MKHFKDSKGVIHGIEGDGSQDFLIQEDWQPCEAPELLVDPIQQAKTAFRLKLLAMTHDFGDGRVIQVRPPETGKTDESNIRNAIERMARKNLTSELWYMADNVFHPVTADDLQAALESGQDQTAQAWDELRSSLEG